MSVELIVSIASIVVTWLIFGWLVKVLKASISTAITIAAILLILQLAFGIKYQIIWQEIIEFPETIWQLLDKN
jgi:predicted PurR-regulated permease PerM